ncbi:MAG TPA: AEC family transporter, partial [Clostridiales bacterium]|nr:AEC family transporter [Clostridiales bacterium]
MGNLIFSINAVLPIFLLMCLGILFRRINLFDDNFISKANTFAFNILLPAHLFNNIYKSEISETVDIKLIIFALVINVLIIGIMCVMIPKIEKDKKNIGVMIQGLYRSNFVLFGVPLSINMFGDSNVATVVALLAIMIPFYNFVSVILLDWYSNDKSDYKKTALCMMKNPLIWGCISGIAVSVL